MRAISVAFLVAIVAMGCSGQPEERLYDIRGKVVAIKPAEKKITLDHEDIPGLMKAMEMPFDVADAKLLDGLSTGDRVEGQLKVVSGKYVITRLEKREGR